MKYEQHEIDDHYWNYMEYSGMSYLYNAIETKNIRAMLWELARNRILNCNYLVQ